MMVSSVLNKDVKQFGKKFLFDSNEETCWNSDQGQSPWSWVLLQFPREVLVSEVKVQFQGGFSCRTCRLEGCLNEGGFTFITDFYPEDNNSLQISFTLLLVSNKLKITFENSADFFGRIIVYSLDILGEKM
uniref:Nuclear receptor 2C2-associated protein n=1 Tax=Denticeps clupeoides TaxID=299321 RepID=A0AAY4EEP3_9TELE